MKKYFLILMVSQVSLVIAFLSFSYLADMAMSKDGIGDLHAWRTYSSYAGLAFYICVTLWVVSVVSAVWRKAFSQRWVQNYIAIPPLAITLGWVVMLLSV